MSKGTNSKFRPPAGTACLISGPNCDDFFGETVILWSNEIFVLYGRPEYCPILNRWDHVICKPLTPDSDETPRLVAEELESSDYDQDIGPDKDFRMWLDVLDEDVIQGEYGYERGEFTVYPILWRPLYMEGLSPSAAFKRALDASRHSAD